MERRQTKKLPVVTRAHFVKERRQIGQIVWHNNQVGVWLVPESELAKMHSYQIIPAVRLTELAKSNHPNARFKEIPGHVYLRFNLRGIDPQK